MDLKEELEWYVENMETVKNRIQIRILRGDDKDPDKSIGAIREFENAVNDNQRSKIFKEHRSFFEKVRAMKDNLN